MIPGTIHQIWLADNGDAPPASVLESVATWQAHAPQFTHRLWTREELRSRFGEVEGRKSIQSNYYRVRVLHAEGGIYVDADTLAQAGAGVVLAGIAPHADLIAATLAGSDRYDNTPLGAAAGLPEFETLAEQPTQLYHRWPQYLRSATSFVTLPGDRWNAPSAGQGVLVVHERGRLTPRQPRPSVRVVLDTPAKKRAFGRGMLAQESTDFQVVALRKSGHHAVMRWVMRLVGNTAHHFNDCSVPEAGMFQSRTQGVMLEGDRPIIRLCNFEDSNLTGLIARRKLLVIRNPFHCFASRIAGSARYQADWLNVGLWKTHAREFLGDTSHLGDCWRINFDRWHSSEEYRRDWAMARVGHFDRDDRSSVSAPGESMFDGIAYDGHAEGMAVLDRAAQMRDHPDMQPILADEELHELWARIEAL